MRLRLPPLDTLRVFEVVMRRGTIRQAADELCLTPQAVSQRLKALESHLDQRLFEREASSIKPTPQARSLLAHVQQGLSCFQAGVDAFRRTNVRKQLGLHVSPQFATELLVPNLARFLNAHPDFDVNIVQGVKRVEPNDIDCDAVIHWGIQESGEFEKVPLVDDLKVLVVSPRLLQQGVPNTAAILSLPRVSCQEVEFLWAQTLDLLGMPGYPSERKYMLDTNAAMAEAVVAGLGVGLVSHANAVRHIESNELVAPFGRELLCKLPAEKTPRFTLMYSRSSPKLALLRQFADWLIEDVCREELVGFVSRCRVERAAAPS